MSDLRTAAQQALEALKSVQDHKPNDETNAAIAALRAALAQQEPMCVGCEGKPTLQNSPCAVCGKIAQQEQEPVEWRHAGAMPPEQEAMKEAAYELTLWLSAVLDDPRVCQAYKDAINGWFDTAMPVPLEQWVQKQEPVAWRYKGMMGMPWSLSDDGYYVSCKRDKGYMVEPLYTHPPRREPEPPLEPLSAAKIRAEFQDLDRHTLPGEMAAEGWFEAGARYAERQHEIV